MPRSASSRIVSPGALADQRRFGIYNVGWVSVRRRDDGIAALRWWRERCIEWCYDRVEGDRFADQRYLDRLPELFAGVHVIEHLGANLAPWNFADLPASNGATDRWRSRGDIRCCSFIFTGSSAAAVIISTATALYHAPFPELMRQQIYRALRRRARRTPKRTVSPYLQA